MDKVLSARVDESTLHRIGNLSRQLGLTKKAVIENAIQLYTEKLEKETSTDILEQTLGAWSRTESPEKTVEKSRHAFRDAMQRHQK